MLHVITGGSGSGKSAFAEAQVLKAGQKKRIYIATMIPYGEDGKQRVERHRELRKEKQFETMECYKQLVNIQIPEHSVVLLECMSNLVANEVFEPDGAKEHTAAAVMEGVRHLVSLADQVIIVTNEIFSDGVSYDSEMQNYLQALGTVNQRMAEMADQVTEVVYGIPVQIKGNMPVFNI